jgi:hypothetical protein
MSDSEEGSNENNRSNGNNGNNVSFDNPLRGYSRRHSYYDNAFNMDFEYSYLELMGNYGTFVSRTHEMYSNMETCISSMIEIQNERRLSINRRREQTHNNRSIREQQHLVTNENNEHNYILSDSHASHASHAAPNDDGDETRTNHPPVNQNNNNSTRETGTGAGIGAGIGAETGTGTGTGTGRRPLFDIGSVIYSIPRTVLLNPSPNTNTNTNTNTNLNNSMFSRRRRSGGLTISEIEENTEIITYGSIPSNYILNTECPITRETFTPESVVLNLKHCRHCFVPFRMMTWLETHSTCPLCRANVVRVETPQTNTTANNTATNNTEDGTNTGTNTGTNAGTNTNDNIDNLNISNIFNNLIQNSNNDFNNLSIDSLNDNSIMFSFDLPSEQVNRQNSENNPFIIPQIERLMADTLSRNIFNRSTSTYGGTSNTNTNTNATNTNSREEEEDEHYPEVD